MGRLVWLAAALGAAGCGKVATSTARDIDAGPADAYACTGDQLACEGNCFDPMTSIDHCGTCDSSCSSAREACEAGHCVDQYTSCAKIHAIDPTAASNFYTLIDNTSLYCDMTGTGVGYQSLVMNQYDSAPVGYTLVSATDLQDAGKQGAFIALYNLQGGMKVLTAFTAGNCCFKNEAAATSTTMVFLQAADVYPAAAGVDQCHPAGGYVAGNLYQLEVLPDTTTKVFATAPLAATFFTTYPATPTVGCTVDLNPAIFWKVIQ